MPLLAWLLSAALCTPLHLALPCTCVPATPPSSRAAALEFAASFDAVFEGRVLSVTTVPDSQAMSDHGAFHRWSEDRAHIAVTRRWKGAPTDTVRVHSAAQTTMCGFGFEAGARVLMFATLDSLHTLTTSKCTPSLVWGAEAERLARLLGRPQSRR